ncbi:hypothetical Protein YC6258_04540 [Gynuella sunshinyii YC6258]|uniref:Uncharacterized protein n=1 Tax=Gynuella sunshinyii YC6258 TaxID=1445510 RepID=A0A0C5VPJ6_9GAMM|nr:hypothetical Protein YC6258_04540 [Gynuella sunshinyii YC6258]
MKDKTICKSQTDYEESDENIAWIYGEPDSAIITLDGEYVVIAGCGIVIYNIRTAEIVYLFDEPDSTEWTEGVYQNAIDDVVHVRFNVCTDNNNVVTKRLNLKSHDIEVLS